MSPETAQKTDKDWAELSAQLMAANIAVKGLIAIVVQDESNRRALLRMLQMVQDEDSSYELEPTFDENQRRAFTEAMREYSRFATI